MCFPGTMGLFITRMLCQQAKEDFLAFLSARLITNLPRN